MASDLPSFDKPPVVETVMSAQFAPLKGFLAPHAGWYWKECLGESWKQVEVAPPLDDQFERFGEDTAWVPAGVKVSLSASPGPSRVQLVHADDERMIQIQPTRFIYNWRKRGEDYPRYETLRPEFDDRFAEFANFAAKLGLGEPELNQWEITYVNHVENGALWRTPEDWSSIIPTFRPLSTHRGANVFTSFGGEWHYDIAEERGRLHAAVHHGKRAPKGADELLILQLTARGPIDEKMGWDLGSGLDLGHETIVRSFAEMTSDVAHEHWKRRV